jgi:signal transduction histidine kinase
MLENAIKYSVDSRTTFFTEKCKDMILYVKVTDKGLMSKISQKKSFQNYREHTGKHTYVKAIFRFSICKELLKTIMVKFM